MVDAFNAVEHYTSGDRPIDVDHIVVLPLPSTADDADATVGDCTNAVDEVSVHKLCKLHDSHATNVAHRSRTHRIGTAVNAEMHHVVMLKLRRPFR